MKAFNPVPKPPVEKQKKKKQNGWKDKNQRFCFYCRTANAERHEVYRGNPNRQISIDHGFQVDLCEDCHKEMTENLTQRAQERNAYWKQHYQQQYENRLINFGMKPGQARELWRMLIGKNYLEEDI